MPAIIISEENIAKLSLLVEKKGGIMNFAKINFPFFGYKDSILEILDRLIEKGISFKILNLPLCLVLGYKRYCRFEKTDKFVKADQCRKCRYREECPGAPPDYYSVVGATELTAIGPNLFVSEMERCMLKILNRENNIPTARVLEIAKKIKICSNCDDGNSVLVTGKKLAEKGVVELTMQGGAYYWKLKDGKNRYLQI